VKLRFAKMHGTGNDFIVIEDENIELDWPKMAVAMCDRHFGIGADGLLLISRSPVADIRMKIFNADGSQAATCGNGIRCIAKFLVDSGRFTGTDGYLKIETQSGVNKAWFSLTDGLVETIKAGMGRPAFGRRGFQEMLDFNELVDIKKLDNLYAVNGSKIRLDLILIGNRHAVHFIDTPAREYPLSQVGPLIEKGYLGDTNFEVARVINNHCIEARVWENGVGETMACGSGACAIGVAAYLHGYTNDKVDIVLPGGTLKIEWEKQDQVYLTGPAEKVFDGEWSNTGHYRTVKATQCEINEVLA
jgi:diaminopimelate epimerase